MRFGLPCDPPLFWKGDPAWAPPAFIVTREFGNMDFPQYGAHDGLDIDNGGAPGDPIYAMEAGWVTYAGFDPVSGGAGIVRIDHGDGWASGYAHLDRIDVNHDQWVIAGQQIGTLGSTGWVTAPHLHFGIIHNGRNVDPWPLITDSAGGEEPMYNPKDVLALHGQKLVTNAGARIRERQGTSYPILVTLPAGVSLVGTARVVGEPAGGSIEWWEVFVETGGQVRKGFAHSSAVTVVPDAPDDEAFVKGFEEARLKAAAAAAGIKP